MFWPGTLTGSMVSMRILFTANPLVGHVFPMLPLMHAAQDAGHEVVMATGAEMVAEVRRRGFTTWAAGPSFDEAAAELREASRDRWDQPGRAARPGRRLPVRPTVRPASARPDPAGRRLATRPGGQRDHRVRRPRGGDRHRGPVGHPRIRHARARYEAVRQPDLRARQRRPGHPEPPARLRDRPLPGPVPTRPAVRRAERPRHPARSARAAARSCRAIDCRSSSSRCRSGRSSTSPWAPWSTTPTWPGVCWTRSRTCRSPSR